MYYILILSLSLLISSPSLANTNNGIDEFSSQIQTTINNDVEDDYILKELAQSSIERRKKIVSSTVAALVIILVALTPKLLLIYTTMKKTKNRKGVNQNDAFINQNYTPLKHEIKPDLYFEELRGLVIKNDPIFIKRFREAYPDFTHHILEKHPELIKSEFSLCAMIYLDFSAKEIAEYTFIQHRSVQTNRSRLRKKMKLSSQINLDKYIRSFSS